MKLHATTNTALWAAIGRLDRFNSRHPWSHNEHFHGWLLRHLPASRRAAVDVGCGAGVLLGRLADRFDTALGIDRDQGMVDSASRRDFAVDLASSLANPVMGLIHHPRVAAAVAPTDATMPVRDATLSFDEIADIARAQLPGVRLHRRLFFRSTLVWTKSGG